MKTMIWKELRENAKWAILALVCLVLAEFYALNSRDPWSPTLCSQIFLLVTSFGCAIVGAALGILQVLPELRRDQWSSLLHRPVSRSAIFAGKAVAGISLYLAATLIPFLAGAAYAAWPGRFASPFVPGMLIPGLSDICMGLVFYGAGLLICLHQGRWYGSRAAILLSLIPLFIWHVLNAPPFLMPLLTAAVFLLAAWGAMLSSHLGPVAPWPGRASLTAVILTGAFSAVFIAWALSDRLPSKSKPSYTYQSFLVTPEGRVLVLSYTDAVPSILDLQGQPLNDPRYTPDDYYRNTLRLNDVVFDFSRNSYAILTPARFPRTAQAYARYIQNYDRSENWYFLPGQRFFVGFDKFSRKSIGLCDAGGFQPPGTVPQPFSGSLMTLGPISSAPLYWMEREVFSIDTADRSMKKVFTAAPDAPIISASGISDSEGNLKKLVIADSSRLHLLEEDGTPISSLAYQRDPMIWSQISVAYAPAIGRFFFQYNPTYSFRKNSEKTTERPSTWLFETDAQGHTVASYELKNPPFSPAKPSLQLLLRKYSHSLLPAFIVSIVTPDDDSVFYFSPVMQPFRLSAADALPPLALVSLGLALVAFFWARQAGFTLRRAMLWAFFVFCFGLPGLIAFRLAAAWPIFVKCPLCGHRRPIATDDCPACHKTWPAPASNGTEIFEPLSRPVRP